MKGYTYCERQKKEKKTTWRRLRRREQRKSRFTGLWMYLKTKKERQRVGLMSTRVMVAVPDDKEDRKTLFKLPLLFVCMLWLVNVFPLFILTPQNM